MRSAADGLIDLSDPSLCHARRPLLIAHRGGTVGPGAPENSLAAIRHAATEGFDMIEVDVQASADDQPVLFHDDWSGTLRVCCGVDRPVPELTLKELRGIRYLASDEHLAGLDEAPSAHPPTETSTIEVAGKIAWRSTSRMKSSFNCGRLPGL